jgi:hypothetical protein
MNAYRHILTATLALGLAVPAGFSGTAVDTASESPVPSAPAWSEVELGVNKLLFLDGKLEMSRRQRVYNGSGPYHGKMLTLIKTESGVQAFGSDIGSVATFSWIDPATGSTVEFKEIKAGKRVKQLRFREDGYQELQFRPEEGKENTPHDTWPTTKDRFSEYKLMDGSPVPEGQPVRDYYNMVADLGRRDDAKSADYYVATKGRVIRFQVIFGETASRTMVLEDLGGGGEQSLSLQLRRMDLTPWNEDPEDIGGLFAMKGGTEIWLEAETGMLAVVAGEMPGVPGRTEILLHGARFDGATLSQAFPQSGGTTTSASP